MEELFEIFIYKNQYEPEISNFAYNQSKRIIEIDRLGFFKYINSISKRSPVYKRINNLFFAFTNKRFDLEDKIFDKIRKISYERNKNPSCHSIVSFSSAHFNLDEFLELNSVNSTKIT